MTYIETKNVLKGQYKLAQGNALGVRTGEENIVRVIMIIEEKFLFRTKEMITIIHKMMQFCSVRKKIFALIILFSRTVFVRHRLPRALPWAEIYWPFRPGINIATQK